MSPEAYNLYKILLLYLQLDRKDGANALKATQAQQRKDRLNQCVHQVNQFALPMDQD